MTRAHGNEQIIIRATTTGKATVKYSEFCIFSRKKRLLTPRYYIVSSNWLQRVYIDRDENKPIFSIAFGNKSAIEAKLVPCINYD